MVAGLADAQPLALDATLVSSGAGAAVGGPLGVEVAVGQPAIGRSSGGGLRVDLGFLAAAGVVAVGAEAPGVPEVFTLAANYPNPFAHSTTISYALAETVDVRLDVFDVLGRRVRTLVDTAQGPGRYTVAFDAGPLASGIYLYRLAAGSKVATRPMQVVRGAPSGR